MRVGHLFSGICPCCLSAGLRAGYTAVASGGMVPTSATQPFDWPKPKLSIGRSQKLRADDPKSYAAFADLRQPAVTVSLVAWCSMTAKRPRASMVACMPCRFAVSGKPHEYGQRGNRRIRRPLLRNRRHSSRWKPADQLLPHRPSVTGQGHHRLRGSPSSFAFVERLLSRARRGSRARSGASCRRHAR